MSDALIILAVVQVVLLIALLAALGSLLARMRETGRKVDDLVSTVHRVVTEDVRPALGEAREAIRRLDRAAEGAASALAAAEPVVKAVSQVSSVFKKPTTALWLDAVRLAVGVLGIIQSKRSATVETNPALTASEEAKEKEEDVEQQ
ncbi:MAG: hypothetical protein IH851_13570 [Armatimonadetes bacterium]|nr:hypothetical protein [Armatimonadota bacterium]